MSINSRDSLNSSIEPQVPARYAVPVKVLFREAWLELPRREEAGDVRSVGAAVACVNADAFPQELLYGWCERPSYREFKAAECDIGSVEAPPHW